MSKVRVNESFNTEDLLKIKKTFSINNQANASTTRTHEVKARTKGKISHLQFVPKMDQCHGA